jgi:4-methylaminobutanoate oxidase (formaldehyde-forming)
LRVPDECAYYKEDAGKILLGAFEPNSKPWGMNGIPEDFEFDSLPEDLIILSQFLSALSNVSRYWHRLAFKHFSMGQRALRRMIAIFLVRHPSLIIFMSLPDLTQSAFNRLVVRVWFLPTGWIGGGSQLTFGMLISGGCSHFRLIEAICRHAYQKRLGCSMPIISPIANFASARGVRRSPIHSYLEAEGACFGEVAGWERANWFLPESEKEKGKKAEYEYSWRRQNWFDYSAAEHMAVRQKVGMFDMSSFGKIKLIGRDAEAVLQIIAANDVAVPVGKIVYTQFLNDDGHIEADVTVTRLGLEEFLIVTPAATIRRDLHWINGHIPDNAHAIAIDVTVSESGSGGHGARGAIFPSADDPAKPSPMMISPLVRCSRLKLAMLSPARTGLPMLASLAGSCMYLPICQRMFSRRLPSAAMNTRLPCAAFTRLIVVVLKKAFAILAMIFRVKIMFLKRVLDLPLKKIRPPSKFGGMIGADAVAAKRNEGLSQRLMQFRLTDPDPLLYHNEAIYRDGAVIGYLTSGNYGHYLGGAIGLGYVKCNSIGETAEAQLNAHYQIDVAGKLVDA